IRSGETPETPQGVALKPIRFLKKAEQKLYNEFANNKHDSQGCGAAGRTLRRLRWILPAIQMGGYVVRPT
ncbi:MAG: hypothetical protein IKU45_04840, partial [Clostridia bacterium]|nr:hypothetical protein [Clostridia bacterium]